MSYAFRDTDIIIIDGADQPSFPTITQLLGGTYYQVSRDLAFNLLATETVNGVQQAPTKDEMTDILVSLGALVNPSGSQLKPFEESVLSSSVRRAFENRTDQFGRVLLHDLIPALAPQNYTHPDEQTIATQYSRIIQEIGVGRYGHLLDQPDRLTQQWFTVFEVRDLFNPGQEQLASIVISLLFRYVERITRQNVIRKRQVLLIIDEAWKAVMKPMMLQLIVSLYRTGRARWISPHLLSQSTEDVRNLVKMTEDASTVGRYESSPVVACASHIFMFAMGEAEAKVAAATFGLNDQQRNALMKLGGESGKYRELAYSCRVSEKMPRTFTKLRSRPLPDELWAITTAPAENEKRASMLATIEREMDASPSARAQMIRDLQENGWPVTDAINPGQLAQYATIRRLAHKT
jgi:hypothetical protein